MHRLAALVAAALLAAASASADLTAARREPKLEKRARLALENAERMMRTASDAYRQGDWEKTREALAEVQESVELAYTSLKETGKSPRRNPKHFKRAEIKTRDLLRRLEDFRQRLSVEEREAVQPVQAYVQKVHEEFLEGIMGTGKWKKQS